MATLDIQIPPYSGSYELDLSSFTQREAHTIKRISGIRLGELPDAIAAGDNDVVVAITVITLTRAGHQVDENVIWDAQIGTVTVTADGEAELEADDRPPAIATPGGSESSSVAEPRTSDATASSGPNTAESSGENPNGQSPTGLRGLGQLAVSGRTTSPI